MDPASLHAASVTASSVVAPGPSLLLERAILIPPLLLLGGFFAGTETALLSLSRAQREAVVQQAEEGDKKSSRVLWLLSNPQRLITTIILGNEVVNIAISSLMTALVAGLLHFMPQRWTHVLLDEAVVAVLATVVTVPLLILCGELVPKTIGIKMAPRWAALASGPITLITWLLWIPRVVISAVAGAVTYLAMGKQHKKHEVAPALREQEFRTLVDLGSAEGEIAGTERRLIHNVFEFGDLTVGKVMTPASKVFALSVDMPLLRMVEAVSRQRYSRVPLYRGRPDNMVGILFAKDLVGYARGDLLRRPLVDLLHPPLFVPRRAKADRLFREFQRRKTHMALVVDEYGKLAGLVTMEDLLQSLFGGISDTGQSGKVPLTPPPSEGG